MSFEDWQKENTAIDNFANWQNENQFNPKQDFDEAQTGENANIVWDMAIDNDVSLDESERLFNLTDDGGKEQRTGLISRFGKQFYNSTVASVLKPDIDPGDIGRANERAEQRARKDSAGDVDVYFELLGSYQEEEYNRIAYGLGWHPQVEVPETFAEKGVDALAVLSGFVLEVGLMKKAAPSMPDWYAWESVNLANGGEPGHGAVMQQTLGAVGKMIPGSGFVPAVERGGITSALFGTTTYLAGGDTTDILINMGIPFAFESLNFTQQKWAAYKNKNQFIQHLKRKAPALRDRSNAEIEAAISDMTSNLDVLRPVQGEAVTPESLMRNRIGLFQSEKNVQLSQSEQAQALEFMKNRITTKPLMPNVQQFADWEKDQKKTEERMREEFAPKEKAPEISEQVRAYKTQKRYDELVEKANAGNKKAIKELNDYIQGRNIPTYDELLNRVFEGDTQAAEDIQLGRYQEGTEAPKAKLKPPKEKPAGEPWKEPYKKKTRVDRIKENKAYLENDIRLPEQIDQTNIDKAIERGFITSAKEIYPEMRVEGLYIPRATDPLAIKVRNLVYDDLAMAEKLARRANNDYAVATASELVKYYNKQAQENPAQADMWYDKAADITVDIAHKLTEAGRTVQAATILGRQTPEGQLRFAAREIQKYNEKIVEKAGKKQTIKAREAALKKKLPELSAKQTEYILKEMNEISRMTEGRDKFIRFQKLQQYVGELVPTPLYKKVIQVWRAGLLTGIKTHGLNIYSNAAHQITETIKDIPASMVDKIAGYFTGERTVTPVIKGLKKGSIEGMGKGLDYLFTGYSEREAGLKLDYRKINFGSDPLSKALNAYTDTIFRTMGAEDFPFYYAAKSRSLFQQAKASGLQKGLKGKALEDYTYKLVNNPTEMMIKNATIDAETAVYINHTTLGDWARAIQRMPGGEIIIPFSRTPSAVAMQIINYSPVGAVKTIYNNILKGTFDQRLFSQELGRSITGTAVMWIGAQLFDAGLITLDRPKTEKEKKMWELQGLKENSVNVNGKWRSIQTFGPVGNLLVIGGQFRRAYLENGTPTGAMAEATGRSMKSFTEQTFVRGINMFTELLTDPEMSANYVAGTTVSSIIPTLASDVARATDVYERRAETVPERLMMRIPGARQTLEPQVTVLGEEKKPTANVLELMIDPTRPSKEISTPVIDELGRLWKEGWEVSPNLLGTRKGYDVLTPQENTELWKRAGTLTQQLLNARFKSSYYQKSDDATKADMITKDITDAQNAAKEEAVMKKYNTTPLDERKQLIFDMRKQGLATQEMIPIALSKRSERAARREQKLKGD